jgi:hypothetical protein
MTDLFLAVVVIGAVIAFGALISVGNERQRRAIDTLHQAYKQWAVQDLRLKRGAVSAQTEIQDLRGWLAKVTSLALGHKADVADYQVHETPFPTVEFHDTELECTFICTLEAPQALLPRLRKRNSSLRRELRTNPVFRIGKKTNSIELSILNAGTMFDVELPIAWNKMTGQTTESGILWVYILM